MTAPDDPRDVLSDDARRISRADAVSMDVSAGRAVADVVRPTLGPRGMDVLLIDDEGDFVVTNDGVTILREMAVDHPAANLVAEAAATQETEVGDGTTTAVVLAGELLREAERLIERGLHQQTIAAGYARAAVHARDALADLAVDGGDGDPAIDGGEGRLERVVATALAGAGVEGARTSLTDLVAEAVRRVRDADGHLDVDHVVVEPIVGGTVRDSELVDGMAIGRAPVHPAMPTDLGGDCSIALVDDDLEPRASRSGVEVVVADAADLDGFYEREERAVRDVVEEVLAVGPDAVFVGGAIDERAQQRLADEGILALRQLRREDLDAVARAVDGTVADLGSLSAADLGAAGRIEQRDTGLDTHLVVEDVPAGRSVTFFVRGGTRRVVTELERAVEDALRAVAATEGGDGVVPGGGAVEAGLAAAVREFAAGVGGREQLAVGAFGEALEVVPRTLAATAGLDPIDALVALRAAHAAGRSATGIDASGREVTDVVDAGVVVPAAVERQALVSAAEAAMLVLRVEEVIVSGDLAGAHVEADDGTDETSEETVGRNEAFIDEFGS